MKSIPRFRLRCLAALSLLAPLLLPAAAAPCCEILTAIPSDGGAFKLNSYPVASLLPDGRIVLAWEASSGEPDHSRIVAAFSADGGRTWGRPTTVIDRPKMISADPNIIVTPDQIQIYSTTRPAKNFATSDTWKSTCPLDGATWSEPVLMPPVHKYVVGKIHLGVTLADGTLLMPYSWDIPMEEGHPTGFEGTMMLKSGVLRSSDDGRTWTPGADMFVAVPRKMSLRATGGVCEPSMVLLPNGEVYALLRTSDSHHYESRSADGGLTWSTPIPSLLPGHNTPAALWRIRGTGDVLVVWDDSPLNRWPLDVALSTDGCHTWSKPRTLANHPGFQSAYPGATQAADGTLLAFWFQILPKGGRSIQVARFNREWLLGG